MPMPRHYDHPAAMYSQQCTALSSRWNTLDFQTEKRNRLAKRSLGPLQIITAREVVSPSSQYPCANENVYQGHCINFEPDKVPKDCLIHYGTYLTLLEEQQLKTVKKSIVSLKIAASPLEILKKAFVFDPKKFTSIPESEKTLLH